MIKKVIAAVLLITLLAVAIVQAMDKKTEKPEVASQETTTNAGPAIREKAPDFALKNLNGETVKLSDLKGKKVMLNFWATWCPPCKAEMPEIEQFYQKSGNDVEILAVNLDPQADVKGFADKNNITFPILLDAEDSVNRQYEIISIPTTFFINSDGVIQNRFVGGMKLEDIEKFTKQLK